jgi:hypothetical protein
MKDRQLSGGYFPLPTIERENAPIELSQGPEGSNSLVEI